MMWYVVYFETKCLHAWHVWSPPLCCWFGLLIWPVPCVATSWSIDQLSIVVLCSKGSGMTTTVAMSISPSARGAPQCPSTQPQRPLRPPKAAARRTGPYSSQRSEVTVNSTPPMTSFWKCANPWKKTLLVEQPPSKGFSEGMFSCLL